jgi:hypothetical protein
MTTEFGSLLRANTPVSRMMTTYTRRGPGQTYLKNVLADKINSLIEHKDLNLEINPLKVRASTGTRIRAFAELVRKLYTVGIRTDASTNPGRSRFPTRRTTEKRRSRNSRGKFRCPSHHCASTDHVDGYREFDARYYYTASGDGSVRYPMDMQADQESNKSKFILEQTKAR